MNLRVDEGTMNRLIHSTDRDETKMTECLQAYVNSGEARWSQLVQAVATYPLNNKKLAKKIAKDHGLNFDRVMQGLQDELLSMYVQIIVFYSTFCVSPKQFSMV